MLALLDEIQSSNDADHESLVRLVRWAISETALLNGLNPGFALAQEKRGFLVNRQLLATLLCVTQFEHWQHNDTLDFRVVATGDAAVLGAEKLNSDIGAARDRIADHSKWMRIVDLGLEKLGISAWCGPHSPRTLDGQLFTVNIPWVVDFLQSTRFMSWGEGGWNKPNSLLVIQEVIGNFAQDAGCLPS